MNINYKLLKDIDKGKYIIVGVSAGPDSMALLHFLHTNNYKVIVAHINHKKRIESDEEYLFLKAYCDSNQLIFEGRELTEKLDGNFQEEARKYRYKFYQELYIKYQAGAVMTGHHGNDQTETMMMRIARGTSLKGLVGIRNKQTLNKMLVLRILRDVSKADIYQYLKDNNVEYRIDNSNLDNNYTRNFMRNNVLESLVSKFPNIHKKFNDLSDQLLELNSYLDSINFDYIVENKRVSFDWAYFNGLHSYLKKELLKRTLSESYKDKINLLSSKHIGDLIVILKSDKKEYQYDLPDNKILHKFIEKVSIEDKPKIEPYNYLFDKQLLVNGLHHFNVVNKPGKDVINLDLSEVKLPLRIRTKKPGDKLVPLGMTGHKKLKEIFIESDISRIQREVYPVVVDSDDEILWLPQIKLTKYCKLVSEKHNIMIEYKRIDL